MSNARVLIVDDDENLVFIYKELLRRHGFDVLAMTSSRKALDVFRLKPETFDLVITDFLMPEMTGIELAKEMLKSRPGLPIILATGFSKSVTPEESVTAGIREYITKPFAVEKLVEMMRKLLKAS